MKALDALRELGDLTAGQWGMVTTAQATARGISRLQLSRLVEDGQLERVQHGIYRDMGAPYEQFEGVKAAWLSINPKLTARERIQSKPSDAVVSGSAASHLLGLGDLVPEPYQFTVPARRQTQRDSLTFRIRKLPATSVTIREGLPVTTAEQTIADLVEDHQDLSLVGDVLADAETVNVDALVALLGPLAARHGFKRGDGASFYAELERLAHRDADSLARAVSNTTLAAKIAQEYFRSVDLPALSVINKALSAQIAQALANVTPLSDVRVGLAAISDTLAAQLAETLRPNLDAINKQMGEALAAPMKTLDTRTRRQLADMAAKMKPTLAIPAASSEHEEDR
jgi:hypothetical protein